MELPQSGSSADEVLKLVQKLQSDDADWRNGQVWKLVYYASDEILDLVQRVYATASSINGLSRISFPSLVEMERGVIEMCTSMFHAPSANGSVTSGGSESILLAVKAARDRFRDVHPEITRPELIVPETGHPAFTKAAHLLYMEEKRSPVDAETQRADVHAVEAVLSEKTALVVGSAPSYWYGVIDPIEELANLAASVSANMHVDCCIGGFMLPFVQPHDSIPPFDFGVRGVSSISADIHKYGYGPKGSSAVLYASPNLFEFQPTQVGDYWTPNISGTRPGGAIAAAWAVMNFLGRDGYTALVGETLKATNTLLKLLADIPGVSIPIRPDPTGLLAFAVAGHDVADVAAALQERGWQLGYQTDLLPSIHLTVTPVHLKVARQFADDLRDIMDMK